MASDLSVPPDHEASGGVSRGLLGDSARIAVASGLSRATGLLRIVLAAAVLGSTVLGDLFVAINVLPLTLYDVFAGSAISSVLVPPLVRFLDRGRKHDAQRLIANVLGILGLSLSAIVVVAVLARSWIAELLTAGVKQSLQNDGRTTAGLLLLFILPQLVVYGAIGVFVSVQHAHQRFLLPSAAPIVESLGLLITIGVVWVRFESGLEVTNAPTSLVLTLAIGSGLSVLAHFLVQLFGALKAIDKIGVGLEWRHPDIVGLKGPIRDSFSWSSTIAGRQFALVIAAGFAGAGGIQAFEMATLAYFIPVALIGRPIASAALPRLTRSLGQSNNSDGLLRGYLNALRITGWLVAPAGLGLLFAARPLADLVARGEFADDAAITMIQYGFIGLGIGAVADALFEVGRQATMAMGDGAALTKSTWVRAATAIAGIPAVALLLDGPAVILGLGFVVSLGDVLAFAIVHLGLRSKANWPKSDVLHWPRILLAALLAVLPLTIVGPLSLAPAFSTNLVAVATSLITVYVLAGWITTGRGRLFRQMLEPSPNSDLI